MAKAKKTVKKRTYTRRKAPTPAQPYDLEPERLVTRVSEHVASAAVQSDPPEFVVIDTYSGTRLGEEFDSIEEAKQYVVSNGDLEYNADGYLIARVVARSKAPERVEPIVWEPA